MTSIHITEEGLLVGIKRDESFMIKSDSLSPIRKRRILEPKSKIQTTHKPCKELNPKMEEPLQASKKDEINQKQTNNDETEGIGLTVKECQTPENNKQELKHTYTSDPNIKELPMNMVLITQLFTAG